jgi:ABC-type glycerol-3-phosphate transport system permease component
LKISTRKIITLIILIMILISLIVLFWMVIESLGGLAEALQGTYLWWPGKDV